jgi:16S rRNA (uracil1498-N3)-methyltransferase
MNRFYIDRKIEGDTLSLTDPDQLHHLRDVLRLRTGERIVVFDNQRNEYAAAITGIERLEVRLQVLSVRSAPDRGFRLTIGCAIPKKASMDDIIDHLTQMDVDRIIPLETERVIVKLDQEKKAQRLARWKTIALNAAQQSQRSSLPRIDPVTPFDELVKNSGNFRLKLIPNLEGRRQSIREVLQERKPNDVLAVIGPEGDFSPAEVKAAVSAGFIPVSLGSSVLRVDTAALAVASFIKFFLQ